MHSFSFREKTQEYVVNIQYKDFLLTIIFMFTLITYFYLTRTLNYWKIRGIKGPNPIPLLGNFYTFSKSKMSPFYSTKIYNEYKEENIVGIFIRREPRLILRSAKLRKAVLVTDSIVFPIHGKKLQFKVSNI